MFVAGAYVGYLALHHVQSRVEAWLDPFHSAGAYQLVQGLYGMGWGGLVGRGLGQGQPQITPLAWSDFILPSLGEELGLTGVMAVILLYGILVERGLRTALICRDNFGKLLATGLAVVLALQVFVVIGGVTRLIPLTGLTTPFLSQGGSSLVVNWAIIALLLRISDQARRPPPELVEPVRGLRRRRDPGGEDPQVNKPIRNLAVACMLMFVALLVNVTYVQYWQADKLTSLSAHPDNKRVRDAEFARERGAILVRGKAVAESNKSDDAYKFQRVYPQGPEYAHLTGFFSRDWGLGGVEATQNSILSGSDSKLFVNRVIDLVDNQSPKGGSVTLTIDPDAQKAAYDGLKALGKDVRGSVVAIEPSTGKILAMVSSPTFDPNRLATHDFSKAGRSQAGARGAEAQPAEQPGHRGGAAAGFDVQAGHGWCRAGLREVQARHPGPRWRHARPAADQQGPRQREPRLLRTRTRSP